MSETGGTGAATISDKVGMLELGEVVGEALSAGALVLGLGSGGGVDVEFIVGGMELGIVTGVLDVEHPRAATSIKIIIEAIAVDFSFRILALTVVGLNR